MVYLLDLSVTDGSSVSKDYASNAPKIQKIKWLVVEDVTAEDFKNLPDTILIGKPSSGKLPDVFGYSMGPFYVSQRLHDILEELEPGRHTFIPRKVKSTKPIQGMTDHGTFYLIYNPIQIKAVIVEETQFAKGFGETGYNPLYTEFDQSEDVPRVLSGRVIECHHFWRGGEKAFQHYYFGSDELYERYLAEGLSGWEFRLKFKEK